MNMKLEFNKKYLFGLIPAFALIVLAAFFPSNGGVFMIIAGSMLMFAVPFLGFNYKKVEETPQKS